MIEIDLHPQKQDEASSCEGIRNFKKAGYDGLFAAKYRIEDALKMAKKRSTKAPEGPIECFENKHAERDYEIRIQAPEFTAVCPRTGQPDFATLTINYVPDKHCLELKSLKLYLQSYRNRGIFHEDVTNTILNDLVASCRPRRMTLRGEFNARGGISTTVTVHYP